MEHKATQRTRFTSFIDPLARFGVQIFFVISGFLITTLLLRERACYRSTVDLLAFYRRRTFRIFPAAMAYILVVVSVWAAIGRAFQARYVFGALTYTMNYMRKPPWQLRHLWSLGVEEQFYIVWPILFTPSIGGGS